MKNVVVICGASSELGGLTARALARAGHTVYAGMRETGGFNAPQVRELERFAAESQVALSAIEMDVSSNSSVDRAIAEVVSRHARLDVIVHSAGQMVFGPAEAFSPEQLHAIYDTNVLSTQRVNRAVLPHMRAQQSGLVIWVSSSRTRGGTPPFLAPYVAAQAAMESLAVSYAAELARSGIETTIAVPGALTSGTNQFKHAIVPIDRARAGAYGTGVYAGFGEAIQKGLAETGPVDFDPARVAEAIVKVVDAPAGTRPFRVHVDPGQNGCEVVNAVADRIRAEFLRRIGLEDLLRPRATPVARHGRPLEGSGGP